MISQKFLSFLFLIGLVALLNVSSSDLLIPSDHGRYAMSRGEDSVSYETKASLNWSLDSTDAPHEPGEKSVHDGDESHQRNTGNGISDSTPTYRSMQTESTRNNNLDSRESDYQGETIDPLKSNDRITFYTTSQSDFDDIEDETINPKADSGSDPVRESSAPQDGLGDNLRATIKENDLKPADSDDLFAWPSRRAGSDEEKETYTTAQSPEVIDELRTNEPISTSTTVTTHTDQVDEASQESTSRTTFNPFVDQSTDSTLVSYSTEESSYEGDDHSITPTTSGYPIEFSTDGMMDESDYSTKSVLIDYDSEQDVTTSPDETTTPRSTDFTTTDEVSVTTEQELTNDPTDETTTTKRPDIVDEAEHSDTPTPFLYWTEHYSDTTDTYGNHESTITEEAPSASTQATYPVVSTTNSDFATTTGTSSTKFSTESTTVEVVTETSEATEAPKETTVHEEPSTPDPRTTTKLPVEPTTSRFITETPKTTDPASILMTTEDPATDPTVYDTTTSEPSIYFEPSARPTTDFKSILDPSITPDSTTLIVTTGPIKSTPIREMYTAESSTVTSRVPEPSTTESPSTIFISPEVSTRNSETSLSVTTTEPSTGYAITDSDSISTTANEPTIYPTVETTTEVPSGEPEVTSDHVSTASEPSTRQPTTAIVFTPTTQMPSTFTINSESTAFETSTKQAEVSTDPEITSTVSPTTEEPQTWPSYTTESTTTRSEDPSPSTACPTIDPTEPVVVLSTTPQEPEPSTLTTIRTTEPVIITSTTIRSVTGSSTPEPEEISTTTVRTSEPGLILSTTETTTSTESEPSTLEPIWPTTGEHNDSSTLEPTSSPIVHPTSETACDCHNPSGDCKSSCMPDPLLSGFHINLTVFGIKLVMILSQRDYLICLALALGTMVLLVGFVLRLVNQRKKRKLIAQRNFDIIYQDFGLVNEKNKQWLADFKYQSSIL